ncbi:MAG: exonuclease domain-containing protein [Kiritimatiellia bacterium]|jgi:DNA polymerase-3 subunit epsilon
MSFIALDRPLAIFDLESTGLNPRTDRILELSVIRIPVKGPHKTKTWLINPGIPIPLETIAIHGISDEQVRNCPKFVDVADEILEFFKGCDLGGFGIGRFDIPMLEEEFLRVGKSFDANGRRQFDAQRIYHKREPRDLTAALRFYCDEEHVDAHGAEADAIATLKVLQGQFARYPDLPTDPDELDRLINERDPFFLDRDGKLRWLDGEITINFGKKKGAKLCDLVIEDPGYLKWILNADFARDTKDIVRDALEGRWPPPPAVTPTSAPADISLP